MQEKQDKTVEFEETIDSKETPSKENTTSKETFPPQKIQITTSFLAIFFAVTLVASIICGSIAGHFAAEKNCYHSPKRHNCERNYSEDYIDDEIEAPNSNLTQPEEENAYPRIGIVVGQIENKVFVAELQGENAIKSGLQVGDEILSYNGIPVKTITDVTENVKKGKKGDNVTLIISRDGQEMEIKTILE